MNFKLMFSVIRVGVFWAVVLAASVGNAGLVIDEGFRYGNTLTNFGGASFTGGVGMAGNWVVVKPEATSSNLYLPTGLTFTNLKVRGGCLWVRDGGAGGAGNATAACRHPSVNHDGTIYGSYLCQLEAAGNPSAFMIRADTQGWDYDMEFSVTPDQWNGTKNEMRLGTGGSGAGTSLSVGDGTVYLVLFKITDLGDQGPDTDITGSMWVLSATQLSSFKRRYTDVLTEAPLNSAGIGSSANQVTARIGTLTAGKHADTSECHFWTSDYITFAADGGGIARFDELRISDTSIDEVVPLISLRGTVVEVR